MYAVIVAVEDAFTGQPKVIQCIGPFEDFAKAKAMSHKLFNDWLSNKQTHIDRLQHSYDEDTAEWEISEEEDSAGQMTGCIMPMEEDGFNKGATS